MAQLFAFRCCRFTFILTLINERILKLMLNSTKRHNALVGSKFWFNKLLSHREVMTRLQNSPYFCVFKYAEQSNKRSGTRLKNRERDWGETLKIRFFSPASQSVWGLRAARAQDSYATLYRFPYWFWEKNRLFCSLGHNTHIYFLSVLFLVGRIGPLMWTKPSLLRLNKGFRFFNFLQSVFWIWIINAIFFCPRMWWFPAMFWHAGTTTSNVKWTWWVLFASSATEETSSRHNVLSVEYFFD